MSCFARLFARWHLPCVAILVLLGKAQPAHAELPSGVDLSWEAPEGCPDGHFVETRVSTILGGGTILGKPSARATRLDVTGRVEQARDGFRLLLEAREGASHRQQAFEDPSCAQLAETASVVIALVISDASTTRSVEGAPPPPALPPAGADPSAAVEGSPHPEPPPATPPAGSARPSAREADRSFLLPSWKQTRALLHADALGDLGSLPRSAVGLQVSLRLEWETGVSVLLSGKFLPKTHGSSEEHSGVEGEFQLSAGALASCQVARDGSVAVHGCVGLELGQLRAEAVGADRSSLHRGLWVAPHAHLGGELLRGPVSLLASAGFAVPLVRKEYVIDNAGTVHEPRWVAARVSLGAGYRF